ncbi:MAG: hypothetical protein LH475_09090 [Cryobacterium sp.]|uniref:hypothetical protein n=1 Tax=unclassified Cryobacterium TaxID=2649013 RepID=UPI0018CBC3FA|nr:MULTISPECIES: hypothetical protein [unclassified Cryobacterium]MCY7404766.1 hypothetical protein [Cryobacterium sp.]MEC5153629.1 hypothetical protein [Cryobacterium sp. CAN_C3]
MEFWSNADLTPCAASATASPADKFVTARRFVAGRGKRMPSTRRGAVLAMPTIVLAADGVLINLVPSGQVRADLQQRLIDRADPTPGSDRGPGAPKHADTVPGAVVT